MRLLYIKIYICLFCSFSINLSAQYTDTPILPAKEKVPGYIGFIVGLGQNFQSGEYYVDCEDCIFSDGVGTGVTLGASYDRLIFPWLKYGIAVFYDYAGINNSFIETEIIPFELPNSSIKENIPVQFRHTANVDVNYLTAMPYLKVEPVKFFFIRLGFGVSYIFTSNIKHDKELLQRNHTLSNGATVNIRIPGTNSYKVNIQDSEIRELNAVQMYLMPALGLKINFSETTYLLPYFQYNLPLTNISEFGKDYKINQWRIMFELGFKLH
jgi:hypothetical protein